jgi:hypothetical protein
MTDFLSMTDLILTNGVLAWVGLRMVKRVDTLDSKVDDHEIRLQLTELEVGRITKEK